MKSLRPFLSSHRLNACAVAAALLLAQASRAGTERFFIGTYTGGESKGIYSATLDTETGRLDGLVLAAETASPAWLTISADGRHLYAANEVNKYKGSATGFVTAFEISGDGAKLGEINQQPSEGRGPCHLSLDTTGGCLFVANYAGGSIAALPLRKDGGLEPATAAIQHTGHGANPKRQEAPHAHQIISDPSGKYVYVADLGLDRVKVYAYDAAAKTLTPAPGRDVVVKDGRGPRHIVFNQAGDRLYILTEMTSEMVVYSFDAKTGATRELQSLSILPDGFSGQSTAAEIQFDATGRHLYASNRGDDSLVVLDVATDGSLTFAQRVSTGGKTPRHFMIDPSGHFLLAANQDTNSINAFRIAPATGKLTAIEGASLTVAKPIAIEFLPQK